MDIDIGLMVHKTSIQASSPSTCAAARPRILHEC